MNPIKINKELSQAITEAINMGICADVQDKMPYNNSDNDNYIYSSTDGYNLAKTIEFIKTSIYTFNKASTHHTSRK